MSNEHEQSINPHIFRAYDIRGIVGETVHVHHAYQIGQAIASLAQEQGEHEIIVGRDGRCSSPLFMDALCKGILVTGSNVIDLGMVPTPLLYFATHHLLSRTGVMVTGSHNPVNYNGFKMVVGGKSLAGDDIQHLYQRIIEKNFKQGLGTLKKANIIHDYLHQVIKNVHLQRPLKIVIDAGNGVTGMIAPHLFQLLGCEVQELFCDVDGNFPHHHPDPSEEKNLQHLIKAVQNTKADVGIAFDGDGDRLGVVTNQGTIIWPDRLLMLFAQTILQHNAKAKIIFDVKCTGHLHRLISNLGGEPIMWKTGHSFIKTKLLETDAALAGEMSGHFFFNDRWYGFDDALYAAARLLEILTMQKQNLEQLFTNIPNSINTPELKIAVQEEEKIPLMQRLIEQAHFHEAEEIMTIDGVRINFRDGWGLLRASNTSPYLILRFEAINEMVLTKIQALFRHWLLTVKPDWVLPF